MLRPDEYEYKAPVDFRAAALQRDSDLARVAAMRTPSPTPQPKPMAPPPVMTAPTPTKVMPQDKPIIAKQDMGFLSNIAQKFAPKIVAATTIGGSKSERDLLKSNVSKPVFTPVYEKFGRDFETGAKIAGTIATVAGAPLLASVLKKATGPLSTTAVAPNVPATGPLAAVAQSTPQSNMPAWLLPVAIGAGLLLMLGGNLKRLFR